MEGTLINEDIEELDASTLTPPVPEGTQIQEMDAPVSGDTPPHMDVSSMSVPQLRQALAQRNLWSMGNEAALLERLTKAMEKEGQPKNYQERDLEWDTDDNAWIGRRVKCDESCQFRHRHEEYWNVSEIYFHPRVDDERSANFWGMGAEDYRVTDKIAAGRSDTGRLVSMSGCQLPTFDDDGRVGVITAYAPPGQREGVPALWRVEWDGYDTEYLDRDDVLAAMQAFDNDGWKTEGHKWLNRPAWVSYAAGHRKPITAMVTKWLPADYDGKTRFIFTDGDGKDRELPGDEMEVALYQHKEMDREQAARETERELIEGDPVNMEKVRHLISEFRRLNEVRDVSSKWMGENWTRASERAVKEVMEMGSQVRKPLVLFKHAANNPGRVTKPIANLIDFHVETFRNIAGLTLIKYLLILMRELHSPQAYGMGNLHLRTEAQRAVHRLIDATIHHEISKRLWSVEIGMETLERVIAEFGADPGKGCGKEFLFTAGPTEALVQAGFTQIPVLVVHSLAIPLLLVPEGPQFRAWECPSRSTCTRTYYVDRDRGRYGRKILHEWLYHLPRPGVHATSLWEEPPMPTGCMSTCERSYPDERLCEQIAFIDEFIRSLNFELRLPVGEPAVVRWEPWTQFVAPHEGGPERGQAKVAIGELVELHGYTGERTHLNDLVGRVMRVFTNTMQPDWYDVSVNGLEVDGEIISVRWDRIRPYVGKPGEEIVGLQLPWA